MKKNRGKYIPFFLVFFGMKAFSQPGNSNNILRIGLHTDFISDSSLMKPGMGNLFFSPGFDSAGFRFPGNWKQIEIAAIIEKSSYLLPVYIAKHQDETGRFRYCIDKNYNNSFLDEEDLEFRRGSSSLNMADVLITFRSRTDSQAARKIAYQILTTTEGRYYEYALRKEYSTGVFQSEGIYREIELYSFFREPYFSSTGKSLTMALDINADGIIHKSADYLDSVTNVPVRNEIIRDLSAPVIVASAAFQFRRLDTEGKWIEFEKIPSYEGFTEGLNIPSINHFFTGAERREEERVLLNKAPLTLLILSSTSCIPCERIRPELNKIDETFSGKGLTSLIMLREQAIPEINKYFSEHMYKAKTLFSDEESWKKLNSATIVPMFYLVDKNGKIIYKGIGAGDQQVKLLRWYISNNLP